MVSWYNYLKSTELLGESESINSKLDEIFNDLITTIDSTNGIIFTAGNGGSASTAEHFSADLSLLKKRSGQKCRSLCLNSNISLNTALANDISYSAALSENLVNLANSESIVVIFSASGNSENLLELRKTAKDLGVRVWALLGFDGGLYMKSTDDSVILFHSQIGAYGEVENIHMIACHFLIDKINENYLDMLQ